MKRIALALAVASSLFTVACGPADTSGTGGGGGTTSQTCTQRYGCINGSCTCSEGPKKDSSCCDPSDSSCTTNKCDSFCRYCQ